MSSTIFNNSINIVFEFIEYKSVYFLHIFFLVLKTKFFIVVFLSLFAYLGIKFPDVDKTLKIGHRSGFTHSAIIPMLIYLTCIHFLNYNKVFNVVFAGFFLGIALHLIYDLFPKAWKGTALIKMGSFSFNAFFSKIYIFANAIFPFFLSLYILLKDISFSLDTLGFFVIWIISIYIVKYSDEKIFIRPVVLSIILLKSFCFLSKFIFNSTTIF